MNIPKDSTILLSFINTKLRDDYKDLKTLCYELEIDESVIKNKLATIGYTYNPKQNRFIWLLFS